MSAIDGSRTPAPVSSDAPAEAAPAAAAGAAPAVDPAKVEKDVDGLFKAMKKAGTDEEAIYGILEGRTPDERQAIEERFGAKYCRKWPSLRAALADEMSGKELDRAMSALDAGKPSQQRGEILADYGKGGGAGRAARHFGTWFMFGTGDAKKAAADGCPRVTGAEIRRDLLPHLRPGDVLLCGNGGNVSHAIVYVGDGKIIHSMASKETLKSYGGRALDAVAAPVNKVLEAMGKSDAKQGVIEEGLEEFFDRFERDTYVVMRSPKLTPEGAEKGLERIRGLVGKGYDWDFAPGNDSYYCTEVAGEFLRASHGKEAPRIGARAVKHGFLLDRKGVVDPLDVLASPDLKPVHFNKAATVGPIKGEIEKKRDI